MKAGARSVVVPARAGTFEESNMIRKYLLVIFVAAFAAGSFTSAYANPDTDRRGEQPPDELIVVTGSDLTR